MSEGLFKRKERTKKNGIRKGSIDFYKKWDEMIGFRNQNEFFD
jgi:hypothetical protein